MEIAVVMDKPMLPPQLPRFEAVHATLSNERIYGSPSLTGSLPKAWTISPKGSLLLFLQGKKEDQRQLDLWKYDLTTHTKELLVDATTLLDSREDLSEEEKSRRERQRLFDKGIVAYSWSKEGDAVLFAAGDAHYLFSLEGKPQLLPLGAHPLDVKLSPQNSYISFVREQNLFLYDIRKGKEMQLTKKGKGTIHNGVAEFVAQEEMNRSEGYWWAPDETKIAYVQIDESPVEIVERCEIGTTGEVKVRKQRYPFAGSPNVTFKVGILDIATKEILWINIEQEKEVYLARLDWFKDSSSIALQLLHRDHKALDLFFADATKGKLRHILREESTTWLSLHNDLSFGESSFVWSSERTGFRHLYLYDLTGELIRPLTSGAWLIKRVVGRNKERLFFEAFASNPLEKHLYTVSLQPRDGPEMQQITRAPGWHHITMDQAGAHYIDLFSSVTTLPQVSFHKADGEHLLYLEENTVTEEHPYASFISTHSIPIFGTIAASDGQDLYYRMIMPVPFTLEKRYPVVVFTYGGPSARLVTNSWGGDPLAYWMQLMAHKGYIVFTLDNRGSSERGAAFQKPVYGKLGAIEVEDQKRGVTFLQQLPYVDGNRIGIFGWSYGGYMTLMALCKAPELFKAGVAVAPVTEWQQYDTCYTERYLGMPQENPQGYAESSVFPYIHKDMGKLLLVHGMADDNVLFSHTVKLMHALQQKQVPFDLMAYPGSKHGITETSARIHLFNKITDFFAQHLY